MDYRKFEFRIISEPTAARERAEKHVKKLKSWYSLIPTNILVTISLAALSFLMHVNDEPNTIIWILMSGPFALWVIFIVQGIAVHKTKAVSAWEDRQIRKYS